jgi:hypothetical protein
VMAMATHTGARARHLVWAARGTSPGHLVWFRRLAIKTRKTSVFGN